jgi:DNA-binding response OmpR family regulator
MITGLPGQLTRCAGIESGATDFVSKPFKPDEIVSKVKDYFLQHAPASAPADAGTSGV